MDDRDYSLAFECDAFHIERRAGELVARKRSIEFDLLRLVAIDPCSHVSEMRDVGLKVWNFDEPDLRVIYAAMVIHHNRLRRKIRDTAEFFLARYGYWQADRVRFWYRDVRNGLDIGPMWSSNTLDWLIESHPSDFAWYGRRPVSDVLTLTAHELLDLCERVDAINRHNAEINRLIMGGELKSEPAAENRKITFYRDPVARKVSA